MLLFSWWANISTISRMYCACPFESQLLHSGWSFLLQIRLLCVLTVQWSFQNSCEILWCQQQWSGVPLSPHPCHHVLLLEFLILAILIGVRWNIELVLICISLMTKNDEHSLSDSPPFQIPLLRIICLAWYVFIDKWLLAQKVQNTHATTHRP